MKILVIGNGSTGIDLKSNKSYINNHTGWFLNHINNQSFVSVGFMQLTTIYSANSNLQNFDIESSNLINHNLPKKNHPKFIIKLIRIILQYDYLYIYFPGSLGKLVGVISKLLKKPYGLYVRGEKFNNNTLDKIVLKNSKFINTISPKFIHKLNFYCKNVELIRPMISIQKKDIKKNRNYDINEFPKFLFVGRVEKAKGIYELISIAEYFRKINLNFTIDIVGGGDLYHIISNQIVAKDLSSNVFLHGQKSDLEELKIIYDNADIFVFPSHHEGFPRVLYEAMASGLPIFTTFVGGIPGRMIHLENCIEIPAKDSETSANIIYQYITDTKTLKYIGKKGQETLVDMLNGSLLKHEELLYKQIFK